MNVLLEQTVLTAAPLVLAGLGETLVERSGVLNLGIEGMMLTGCIAGFAAASISGNPWLGLGCALAAGAGMAAIFAIATVWAKADQIVCGMALNLLALGGSGTVWQLLQAHGHADLGATAGFSGPWSMVWAAGLWSCAAWWMLRTTRAGIVLRALGEAPVACAAAGIDVRWWRTATLLHGGICAGTAGAYLSLMRTHSFVPEMTGGSGFLVLALVIFGRWTILGLVAGCLLFGAVEALQQHLQGRGMTAALPWQLFKAAPYVVALIALAMVAKGRPGPAALSQPWPPDR
jgi:general nucleoside transport system permease protein